MPQKNIIQHLESDRYFHIFNRGINGQRIFLEDSHYRFFLQKYNTYLRRYVTTLAYCLIPNHFHLLIKTRESRSSKYHLKVSNQFRKLFITYSLYHNRQQNRIGNLCYRHFRRVEANKDNYLLNLLFYIHFNPQKHRIISDYRLYPYSSYCQMFLQRPNYVSKDFTLGLFRGNLAEFKQFHMDRYLEKCPDCISEEDENLEEMATRL